MPNDKKSATLSESLTDDQEKEVPTDEGENRQGDQLEKKSPEQLLKEYKIEAKRKGDEISALKAQLEELKDSKEERLEELEEKKHLSAEERKEMLSLEQQIEDIKRDQRSTAWIELNKREAKNLTRQEVDTLDLEYAIDMVEDLADKEGISVEKFEKELKPFLKHYAGERPTRKVKKAYKELQKSRELEKRLADLEKKEKEFVPRETSRTPTAQSAKEILAEAKKKGDYVSALKAISDAQKEMLAKR